MFTKKEKKVQHYKELAQKKQLAILKKTNINSANKADLQQVPGIGESKATAIIEYREKEGLFQTIEDLKNVSGIGEKTVEKLKEYLDVN